MENEQINPEELSPIITLTDENGQEVEFELLAVVPYENQEYVILLPTNDDGVEVVILQLEEGDGDTESYLSVDDPDTLEAVYQVFKERFRDIYQFED